MNRGGDETGTLLKLVGITLAVKLLLAWAVPLTGDEAYFVLWGERLDFGYYDHPPMVGWLIWFCLSLGKSALVVRLPAILATLVVGWLIYETVKRANPQNALPAAALYLLSPLNLLYVIVTTDTPLILFASCSVAALMYARETEKQRWYALSGMALGLCFLSKYFAALLAVAYLVHYLATPKTKSRTLGALITFLCVIPFGLVNLWWNYTHSWANILFNVYNRNTGERYGLANPLTYLAVQAYLATPVLLWLAWTKREEIKRSWRENEKTRLALTALAVPLALLFVVALKKSVGVHWSLSFYPFLYLALGLALPRPALERAQKLLAAWTGGHLLIVCVALLLPLTAYKHLKTYDYVVMGKKPELVLAQLEPYRDYHWATDNYTKSAVLAFHGPKYVSVFASTSRYARQDDFNTNWADFDGKNILILTSDAKRAGGYGQYFKDFEVKEFTAEGATYALLVGRGFIHKAYQEKVLTYIKDKYYRIPAWLPTPPPA